MVAALIVMAALAFMALSTLSGCGGGGTAGAPGPTGLVVKGRVQDELGNPVSGIRIVLLPNSIVLTSREDGTFSADLGNVAAPTSFRVDVSNRANDYYQVVHYNGKKVQGCPLNLPSPVDGTIDIGAVTVYSQNSPPPPPDDICE